MMIPQQSPSNVVQITTSLAQNTGPNTPAVATFAQDRAAQIRFALKTPFIDMDTFYSFDPSEFLIKECEFID